MFSKSSFVVVFVLGAALLGFAGAANAAVGSSSNRGEAAPAIGGAMSVGAAAVMPSAAFAAGAGAVSQGSNAVTIGADAASSEEVPADANTLLLVLAAVAAMGSVVLRRSGGR